MKEINFKDLEALWVLYENLLDKLTPEEREEIIEL
jgi:hypothetical protein